MSRRVETSAPEVPALALPRGRAAAKLRAGRPLLHDEPLVLDLAWATDVFVRLAGQRRLDVFPRLDLAAVLTEAFVQHADHLEQIARRPGLDPQPIADLAEQAVKPLRRAYAERLSHLVDGWQRGYCPICGASPGRAGDVECGACGYAWRATTPEPAFRIELAVADEDA